MSIDFCARCGKPKNPDDRIYGKDCEASFKETGFLDKVMKSKKMQSAIANENLDTEAFNKFISNKLTTHENKKTAIQNKVKEIFKDSNIDNVINKLGDLKIALEENGDLYLDEFMEDIGIDDDRILETYLTSAYSDPHVSDTIYSAFNFSKDNYLIALANCPHHTNVFDFELMERFENEDFSNPEELNKLLTIIDNDNSNNDFLYEFKKDSLSELILNNKNCPDWLVDRYIKYYSDDKSTIDDSTLIEKLHEEKRLSSENLITIAKTNSFLFSYLDLSNITDDDFYEELFTSNPTLPFQETSKISKETQRKLTSEILNTYQDSDDLNHLINEIAPKMSDYIALSMLHKASDSEYTRELITSNKHWKDDASMVKDFIEDILSEFDKIE